MANLSLKLEQKTKLMQVQRLTIQLLALHGQELTDFLQEQVTDNPLLDIRYHDVRGAGDKTEKPIDNIKSRSASLEWLSRREGFFPGRYHVLRRRLWPYGRRHRKRPGTGPDL